MDIFEECVKTGNLERFVNEVFLPWVSTASQKNIKKYENILKKAKPGTSEEEVIRILRKGAEFIESHK